MRRLVLLVFSCLALALLWGCGQAKNSESGSSSGISSETSATASSSGGRLSLAVIPKGTTHEFWKTVHAGAAKAARELDIDITWKGPLKEDDRDAQIAVVEDFVAKGVSGIVLAPLDSAALRGPVSNAQRSGIPVVVFDSGLQGDTPVSYVATDNFKAGQLAGEQLAKLVGEKASVVLLRYNVGSDSTAQREEGFLDALKKHPEIKILSSDQYGGVTAESAQKAGENLLARFKNPDGTLQMNGVFCPNESTSFGMLRALQDAGFAGKVKFIGFDSSQKMLDAISKGEMDGIVVQNPMQIGYLAVKTLAQHLRKQPIEKRVDTGAVFVSKENMSSDELKDVLHPDLEKWLK